MRTSIRFRSVRSRPRLRLANLNKRPLREILKDLGDLPDELQAIADLCTEKLKASGAKAAASQLRGFDNALLKEMNVELNTRLGRLSPEETESSAKDDGRFERSRSRGPAGGSV